MKKIKEKSILTQRSKGEKIVYAIVFVVFMIYALSLIVPFLWVAIKSLENPLTFDNDRIFKGAFFIPTELHFENYINAFSKMEDRGVNFFGMLTNSVWYILIGVAMSIFWHALTGYVFAKYKFRGRNLLYTLVIFSMTVPIVGSTGAKFRLIAGLGLYDKGPLYVFFTSFGGFGGSFLMMTGIFSSISWEYAEAVYIDGGNDFTVFFKIMLPQAMPALSALMINSAIGLWNDYTGPLMYLPSTPTVASGLYKMSWNVQRFGEPLYYAGLTISVIPVIIAYSFISGKMMQNLSIGGLKG